MDDQELKELRTQLKAKLDNEERNVSWFHRHYIKNECGIQNNTFQAQLIGNGTLKPETELIIKRYLFDSSEEPF